MIVELPLSGTPDFTVARTFSVTFELCPKT